MNNDKKKTIFFAICFIAIGLIIALIIVFSLEFAGDQIIPRNIAIKALENAVTELKSDSEYDPNYNSSVDFSLAPGFWEAHYLALGYIGLGIFICIIIMFAIKLFFKNYTSNTSVSIKSSDDLTHLINSYQSIISSYRMSLGILFSIFAIFSVSTVLLNWNGANHLDEMENIKKKLSNSTKKTINEMRAYANHSKEISNLFIQVQSNILSNTTQSAKVVIELCDKILTYEPEHNYKSQALLNKGIAYYRLGDYDTAIKKLEDALSSNQDNPEIFLWKGNALYKKEKYLDSLVVFGEGLKIDPDYSKFYERIGYSFSSLYDLTKNKTRLKKHISDFIKKYNNDIEKKKFEQNDLFKSLITIGLIPRPEISMETDNDVEKYVDYLISAHKLIYYRVPNNIENVENMDIKDIIKFRNNTSDKADPEAKYIQEKKIVSVLQYRFIEGQEKYFKKAFSVLPSVGCREEPSASCDL